MRRFFMGLLVLLITHVAHAKAPDTDAKTATVIVNAAAQQAGGIVVRRLPPATFTPQRAAYGVVLDPGTLIALRGQIVAAQTSRQLAAQSLARAQRLYHASHNIAMAALQNAEASYATADAREVALAAKARVDWGAQLGVALTKGGPIIQALSNGRSSLVEAVVTGRSIMPPPTAAGRSVGGDRITLRLVGTASHAPTGLVGQGFYYAGPANLSIGLPLSLRLPTGAARTGVAVPVKAILYLEGHKSVFREVAPNRFVLTWISGVAPMHKPGDPPRYFVGKGLKPGDRVAVDGAGVLLSGAHTGPAHTDTD